MARQHQGLIANLARAVLFWVDHERTTPLAAVAAAEHDRPLAELAEDVCQRQHGRGLAGAAEMIVADADHRHAGLKALALHALGRNRAIERAERPEQTRCEGSGPVPEGRLTHCRLPSRAAIATNRAPARQAYVRAHRRAAQLHGLKPLPACRGPR